MVSKVAVIIPTHNQANFIGETIESVLAQTYSDIEIIVVDDGSTDGTANVVATYEDRVRYVWQPGSGNPSGPRNKGMGLTSSEYLVFLDSDDVLLPSKIARQVEFLEANPEIDLVFGNCVFMDQSGREIPNQTFYSHMQWNGDASISGILQCNPITVLAPLVRRTAVERVGGFDPNIRPEDYDLWLRIAATGAIAGTNDIVAKIRLGPNRRNAQVLSITRGRIEVYEKFRALFPEVVRENRVVFRKRLSRMYLNHGITLHDYGRRGEALPAIRSALRIDPTNFKAYFRLGLLVLTPKQVLALSRINQLLLHRNSKLQTGQA